MSKELLPAYLKQGETARLFPVLSTTSKEGRTTSIVLACISKVEEFGATLLASVGQKVGKRALLETYTEVVFQKQTADIKDRPDGLIVLTVDRQLALGAYPSATIMRHLVQVSEKQLHQASELP